MTQGSTKADRPFYTGQLINVWLDNWDLVMRKAKQELEWSELEIDVRGAVRTLPKRLQRVFVLHFVMGHGRRDTARIIGSSPGVAQWAIISLRRAIVEALANEPPQAAFVPQGAFPCGRAFGSIGPWDLPMERPR